jgi:hypothetical protein
MRRILAASFAVLSLSLVMGACSSDSKKVADEVQKNLKTETGVQDIKVTCDSNLEAKKGSKGTCTANGDFTAYLQKLGVTGASKITELKFNIEFIDDTTFNPTLDTADLQSKLGGGSSTGSTGSTASSSSDSATSSDDSTSSEVTESSSS